MKYDKEKFVDSMTRIVSEYDKLNKWVDKLETCFYRAGEDVYEHCFLGEAVELLSDLMDDKEEWINFFIYECDCKWFEYEVDGKTYSINGYEELYNLIVGE